MLADHNLPQQADFFRLKSFISLWILLHAVSVYAGFVSKHVFPHNSLPFRQFPAGGPGNIFRHFQEHLIFKIQVYLVKVF
jgi:hypothetical protein